MTKTSNDEEHPEIMWTYDPAQGIITDDSGQIQLPGGFRLTDDCPTCSKVNKVMQVTKRAEDILLNYQCSCGCFHGIIHTGNALERYNEFIEDFITRPD